MAYNATYAVSDFPNIIFDLLGGIGAYFATEVDSIGGILFLGILMTILGWAIASGKKILG
ncbi:MAG: hypothetical protein GOV00_00385 [Candidatus Altiarchaeota archaeon]|nr:hypothetical protein [Candidatus Altiarchaeota archaeon]